jgi:hypothetical protein
MNGEHPKSDVLSSNRIMNATLDYLIRCTDSTGFIASAEVAAVLLALRELKERRSADETKAPHCIHCHCAEAAKGMVDRSDFNRFRNAVLQIAQDEFSDTYETCDDGQDDYWRVVNIARSAASGTDPGSPEEPSGTETIVTPLQGPCDRCEATGVVGVRHALCGGAFRMPTEKPLCDCPPDCQGPDNTSKQCRAENGEPKHV